MNYSKAFWLNNLCIEIVTLSIDFSVVGGLFFSPELASNGRRKVSGALLFVNIVSTSLSYFPFTSFSFSFVRF